MYKAFEVPVDGGAVLVGQWGSGSSIVLGSHGITANHLSWQRVAELVVERSGSEVGFAALDHRGRAGSASTRGDYGLAQHADDLISIADHLGLDRVTLAGHSMGGFVVTTAAERHPDRVERLVLVDGGLPLPFKLPKDADVEAVVRSVIGPALDRLDQRWSSVDEYVDFFHAHPAYRPPNQWSAAAEAYVRHDAVVDADGEVRSSVIKQAVLVDVGAAIVDPPSVAAIERITTPTTLLWAPRGLLDQSPGLYSADHVARTDGRLAHLRTQLVDGTNHYTILVGEWGASAVADAILA